MSVIRKQTDLKLAFSEFYLSLVLLQVGDRERGRQMEGKRDIQMEGELERETDK